MLDPAEWGRVGVHRMFSCFGGRPSPLILSNRFRSVTSREHVIVEILQWPGWVVTRTLRKHCIN